MITDQNRFVVDENSTVFRSIIIITSIHNIYSCSKKRSDECQNIHAFKNAIIVWNIILCDTINGDYNTGILARCSWWTVFLPITATADVVVSRGIFYMALLVHKNGQRCGSSPMTVSLGLDRTLVLYYYYIVIRRMNEEKWFDTCSYV